MSRQADEQWAFLGPDVCVVSPFGSADGIARYAEQFLGGLGPEVAVRGVCLSSRDARGLEVTSGLRSLRLLRFVPHGTHQVLMWHPLYFVRGRTPARILCYLALAVVLSLRRTTIVLHEAEFEVWMGGRLHSRIAAILEEGVRRLMWSRVGTVVVHSDWERRRLEERFPGIRLSVRQAEHGREFALLVEGSRSEARDALGLPAARPILLCLGHLSAAKGFDRAVRAFRSAAGSDEAQLFVVGDAVHDIPEVRSAIDAIRSEAEGASNVIFNQCVVDNLTFDLWLRAADVLIAAFRSASSSSTVPRARMLGARIIASRVGALPEQVGPDDTLVSTDEELQVAIAAHIHRLSAVDTG